MLGALPYWRRSYAVTLSLTIALVAVADFLFYGHVIGWTTAIAASLLVAALALRQTRFLTSAGGRILLLATAGMLLALIEQPTWFNIAYLILCLGTLALTNRRGWESDFSLWAKRWTRWAATGWTRLFIDNGIAMRWLVRHGISPGTAKSISAWSIPAVLSAVFIAIFAWANPIISNWFSELGDWLASVLQSLPDFFNASRMFFWLMAAVFVWALLRGRAGRRLTPPPRTPPTTLPQEAKSDLAAGVVVRCLILFNLIFVVENLLDAAYLWGHHAMPTGTEYKQYVRRGAYPLVAAALLAGTFVLVTFRPGSQTERSRWARKLVYVWIAQTILLTISAAWRLGRYIELTELTRLRVASAVWFLLVGTGLAYIVWRIIARRDNRWLININAVTALVVLYTCCFVNFDGLIANFNAGHCSEAGGSGSRLDIEYFQELGPASVAALDSVRDRISFEPKRQQAQEISAALHAELSEDLHDWRGWTWRRHRVAKAAAEAQLARAAEQGQVSQTAMLAADPAPAH